ncbi:MAG TPA: histidine kinase [Casimicrobiaceae bacterium]|nr:histidine kinase [Casimicrobiaceae bacterium]
MPPPITADNAVLTGNAAIRLADPRSFWRRPLAGLTPQLIVIVYALMLMRSLSADGWTVLEAARNGAVGLWLADLAKSWLVIATKTALPMLVAITATANLGPQCGPKRVAALAAAVILSAGFGAALRRFDWNPGMWAEQWDHDRWGLLVYVWPRYAFLGGLLTVVGELYRRELASRKATQRAEIDQAAFEREMAEARLEVLQAQIEPHFLFNTLANVRRLYDKDPAAGARMLEHLMRYFEVALPRMRENESTLDRDAGLLEAFLCIHQIRMGPRLAFSVDVPPALRGHRVPPMMLLTLVENAIKHGLNPSPSGGMIRVVARAEGERLILSVADTGVGFVPGSGAGTGLANIRARLAAQFGDRASLALENNDLGGATARIALPLAPPQAY